MSRTLLTILNVILVYFGISDSDTISDGRIVGGIGAIIEDFPYQVSLCYKDRHFCGGSIISSKLVVTAAHCTDSVNASLLSIRAGSASIKEGGEIIEVESIEQHPEYNSQTTDYDISILKLKTELKFSDTINSISIFDKEVGPHHYAVVTGWGTMQEGGKVSDTLRQVYVPIMSMEECKKFYGANKITDRMICAGYTEGGHDSCQGDSGGPLVYRNKLVGIVSWGIGCARAYNPGVYTSVSGVRSYFNSFLGKT